MKPCIYLYLMLKCGVVIILRAVIEERKLKNAE